MADDLAELQSPTTSSLGSLVCSCSDISFHTGLTSFFFGRITVAFPTSCNFFGVGSLSRKKDSLTVACHALRQRSSLWQVVTACDERNGGLSEEVVGESIEEDMAAANLISNFSIPLPPPKRITSSHSSSLNSSHSGPSPLHPSSSSYLTPISSQ